jgi:hypothetical protein
MFFWSSLGISLKILSRIAMPFLDIDPGGPMDFLAWASQAILT